MLIKLWINFLQIGLMSFGGGYAVIPLIQQYVVDTNGWLDLREYTDIITISQMTPGPVAVNTSTFVGTRIAGLPGAVVATVGCVLPGVIISFLLYKFFTKHGEHIIVNDVLQTLKAASAGLIAAAAATILLLMFWGVSDLSSLHTGINLGAGIVFAVCLFSLRKFRLNPILVIVAAGIAGCFLYT